MGVEMSGMVGGELAAGAPDGSVPVWRTGQRVWPQAARRSQRAASGQVGALASRSRSLAGVTALCVVALLAVLVVRAPFSSSGVSRAAPAGGSAVSLPGGLAAAASESVGAAERGFWLAPRGGALAGEGGGIASSFAAEGARLRVAEGTVGFSLAGIGRGQQLTRVVAVAPVARANEALYRDGSVRGFYRNGPFGVEQGFTVARRPGGGAGRMVLTLRVGGSLTAVQAGSQVLFETAAGAAALRYGQLSAVDATGRRLPATMRLDGGALQLRVDDRGARYPLRIDPFVEQVPKLTGGTEESGKGDFGGSVALSADGKTALVGAPEDDSGVGAVWVFVRSGSTWTQQGSKLTGAGEVGAGKFGTSVALSASGYTALIGAPGDHGKLGAAWVFTRTGSTWTRQGPKLTGGGEVAEARFGYGVALSADGNTALIGGPDESEGGANEGGAAWVFTRTGSTWTQQGSKLTGTGEVIDPLFGFSVALSADGNTALIGGPEDDIEGSNPGAAWVFTRSGSTWTQQGPKLTGTGEVGRADFGYSVALSGEGNTALIGAPRDESEEPYSGAAWVFARSGSTWTRGPKLDPLDELEKGGAGEQGFGRSVALSTAGTTALVSTPGDNRGTGAAWTFAYRGSTWVQQGPKLTGAGEVGKLGPDNEGNFGGSVALAGDASAALVGGEVDNGSLGAAWAFANIQPGCTDSWTNTAGGNWFTAEDWSTGAPPGPEEEACITAPGTYTVTMQQTSTTGTVAVRSLTVGGASGTQTLNIASSCSENASVATSYGITNGWQGAIAMTNSESCAKNVSLAGGLVNNGKLYVEDPSGGTRSLEGDLTNSGTVSLAAGERLAVSGGYQQTPTGRLKTFIAGASNYGSLSATGGFVIAGTLVTHEVSPFKAALGSRFEVLVTSNPNPDEQSHGLEGAFATEAEAQIGYYPTLYFQPAYSHHANGEVLLTVKEATATLSPKSGMAGASMTIGGKGYLPGDTITPTFTDHAGVKTAFPGVTVASSGTFSTTITVPAGAASGEATVTLQSAETGVKVKRTVTVT